MLISMSVCCPFPISLFISCLCNSYKRIPQRIIYILEFCQETFHRMFSEFALQGEFTPSTYRKYVIRRERSPFICFRPLCYFKIRFTEFLCSHIYIIPFKSCFNEQTSQELQWMSQSLTVTHSHEIHDFLGFSICHQRLLNLSPKTPLHHSIVGFCPTINYCPA